jgi:hypothetical protein
MGGQTEDLKRSGVGAHKLEGPHSESKQLSSFQEGEVTLSARRQSPTPTQLERKEKWLPTCSKGSGGICESLDHIVGQ